MNDLHLFLSPHLDDAVLSCGGQIAQLTAAGHTVVVYTVMAGRPSGALPSSPILDDLHARWETPAEDAIAIRRREDNRAARALGAVARHGRLLDCVYRVTYTPGGDPQPLYPSEESLWAATAPGDTAALLLDAMPLPYPAAAVVHAPLGAGRHVDHRLVRDWARRLARLHPGLDFRFYEDYPYLTQPDAVRAAVDACAPDTLTPHVIALDDAALTAKTTAIAHYTSQISTFWADAAAMTRAVRDDAVQVGGGAPAEREWRLAPPPQAGETRL